MDSSPDVQWLRAGRGQPMRLFRTVQLNAVGWTALLAASLTAGCLLAALSSLFAASPWFGAVAGLLLVPVAVLVLDRRRYRRGWTSFSWTDDAEEVARVADLLRERGRDVRATGALDENPPALWMRQRDRRRVSADLRSIGLPTPGGPPS